jgi:hypothetical protein
MIEHQKILHIHPVKKLKIDLFDGNGSVQIFGKPVRNAVNYKRLEKSSLDQNPQNQDQHKDA